MSVNNVHFICQSANFEVGQSNKLGMKFNIIQPRQVGKVVGLLDKLVGMFDSQPLKVMINMKSVDM